MSAQKKVFVFLLLILFLTFPFKTLAAMKMGFSNAPASIEEETPFELDVSLIGAPVDRVYYLRAVFHEANKTQYFGYTYNHQGNWHNTPSEHTLFLEITTSPEGSWSGKLRAKADTSHSAFKGAGEYQFKIGRYTEGGSLSWSDNSATITISVPPTPTATFTPTPTPTNEPEPTATCTPTPTATLVPTPTVKKIPTPTLTQKTTPTAGLVLGEEKEASKAFFPWVASQEAEAVPESTPAGKKKGLAIALMLTGLGLLFGAGFWIWYHYLKEK